MATKYHLRDMDGSGIYPEQFRNPVGQNQVEPSVRCPHCMKVGIFHSFNGISDLSFTNTLKHPNGMPYQKLYLAGLRGCPNSECRGLLFVIIEGGGNLVLSHPAEVLDFDASDLPPRLSLTLEEAISCHSHRAYRAAAMMVRRLLEVLCDDMGASGANLKERIAGLRSIIIMPKELLEAADELRLLGNDAAHIEAKLYDEIGEPQVRLAISVAKEILKATYQYKGLLDQLKALGKSSV